MFKTLRNYIGNVIEYLTKDPIAEDLRENYDVDYEELRRKVDSHVPKFGPWD